MSRIRKIVILVSLVNLFIFQSVNVLADNQIASDSFTHEEIVDSLEDDPKDMTLVEELRKDLDETTYIEIRIYEKENSGLTKAGYKTKLGMIIPAPFEPPVRSLRATLPAHQSHTFR